MIRQTKSYANIRAEGKADAKLCVMSTSGSLVQPSTSPTRMGIVSDAMHIAQRVGSPQPCWWSNLSGDRVGLGVPGRHQQLTRMGIERLKGLQTVVLPSDRMCLLTVPSRVGVPLTNLNGS